MSEVHTMLRLCRCLGSMVTVYGHRLFFFFVVFLLDDKDHCIQLKFFPFSFYFVLFVYYGLVVFAFVLRSLLLNLDLKSPGCLLEENACV